MRKRRSGSPRGSRPWELDAFYRFALDRSRPWSNLLVDQVAGLVCAAAPRRAGIRESSSPLPVHHAACNTIPPRRAAGGASNGRALRSTRQVLGVCRCEHWTCLPGMSISCRQGSSMLSMPSVRLEICKPTRTSLGLGLGQDKNLESNNSSCLLSLGSLQQRASKHPIVPAGSAIRLEWLLTRGARWQTPAPISDSDLLRRPGSSSSCAASPW